MDTILVVNAGSSSVKFQVFAVDGEGRLRREIKGQVDGIGSRPRLRATAATGDTMADRAYPIEKTCLKQSIPNKKISLIVMAESVPDGVSESRAGQQDSPVSLHAVNVA